MIHLALDWRSYHNALQRRSLDPATIIRRAALLGAEGVALDYFGLPTEWRQNPIKLQSLQKELRLTYGLAFGLPLILPNTIWDRAESHLDTAIELAQALEVKAIRFTELWRSPLPWKYAIPARLAANLSVRLIANRVRRLCEKAEKANLIVAVENYGDLSTDTLMQLVERIDHPLMKVAVSTGHPIAMRKDPYLAIDKLAPHAVYVRLEDLQGEGLATRAVTLGEGRIDFAEVFRLLLRHHYDGLCGVLIDLPPWHAAREDKAVEKSFVYLTKLRDRLEKEMIA
jgi:sugar phosphate isomerase/epimerase